MTLSGAAGEIVEPLPPSEGRSNTDLDKSKAVFLKISLEVGVAKRRVKISLAMTPLQLDLLFEPPRSPLLFIVLVAPKHGRDAPEPRVEPVLALGGDGPKGH